MTETDKHTLEGLERLHDLKAEFRAKERMLRGACYRLFIFTVIFWIFVVVFAAFLFYFHLGGE